ncbi:hypothetical protein ABBQ38_007329 [Trebouxia sp. C0009 RCD-2024]
MNTFCRRHTPNSTKALTTCECNTHQTGALVEALRTNRCFKFADSLSDCEQDMSSAISKQVNESLAKDKEGDKQGLGEQNPCEFCSKGCTCGTSCSCGSDCTCKSCSGAQTAAAEPKHKETAKAEGK